MGPVSLIPTPLIPSRKDLRAIYRQGIGDIAARGGLLYTDAELDAIAREAYPPKMVTRVREVVGRGGLVYRVAVGELQVSDAVCTSRNWRPYFVDEMQRIVADLFANPTETVEVD